MRLARTLGLARGWPWWARSTLAGGAFAAPPAAEDLNPPPPDFLVCKPLGAGTTAPGPSRRSGVASRNPSSSAAPAGRVCIHDNAVLDSRATRWYNADGGLTKRVIQDRWNSAFWSNPLTGKTVPYTQTDKITTVLAYPATSTRPPRRPWVSISPTPRRTRRFWPAPDVWCSEPTAARLPDGSTAVPRPFVDGDLFVFDAVCSALA